MRKYKNKPIVIDGIRFMSQKEGARYLELKQLERVGLIQDLELQPVFDCRINNTKMCKYLADFRYRDTKTQEQIVEDVKGFKTAVYRLKKKLVKALFGVDIVEI